MNSNDDTEILDLDMDDIITYNKSINDRKVLINDTPRHQKIVPKKKLKKGIFQTIFCVISLLFIMGCFIFYGQRLIKYYKVYNPKASNGNSIALLYKEIIKNSPIVYDKDGLYKAGTGYIYKGEEVNNYIKIGSLTFRIVSISTDGYIEAVLDDYINVIEWNKEIDSFIDSDIYNYLNDKFLSVLDKSVLAKSSVCTDRVTDLSEITCNNVNTDNYVKLLNINSFLNSIADGTYISTEDETIWLSNYGDEKVWHTNGENVSYSDPDTMYLVKPVVTINNNIAFVTGNGTKSNPYLTSKAKKELTVGSYVKLGSDLWIVYEENEKDVKLVLNKLLSQVYQFSSDYSNYSATTDKSIGKYLNTTYYENLSYKELLLDTKWYVGSFKTSYKDIYKSSTNAKVGIYNLADLKFNNNLENYYLSTYADSSNVYVYGEDMRTSKATLSKGVRPTISISKGTITEGNGYSSSPYILGGN